MSSHYFRTVCDGKRVQVMLGWDRPLQGHFLVVENLDQTPLPQGEVEGEEEGEEEDDTYLYSNLSDEALAGNMGYTDDLSYFTAVLEKMGITVPEKMIAEVHRDRENNTGNRRVVYGADGNPLGKDE